MKISELDLPIADAKILGGLFHVVNDIERIGDHAENFAEAAKERMEKQIPFSEKAIRQIREMAEMVTEVLDYALQMFSERSTEHMKEVLQLEEAVDQLERKLQKAHVKRLDVYKRQEQTGCRSKETAAAETGAGRRDQTDRDPGNADDQRTCR